MDRRVRLTDVRLASAVGEPIPAADLDSIRSGARLLNILTVQEADAFPATGKSLRTVVDKMLYRLDVIPAGLVMGQAAYESGYGPSFGPMANRWRLPMVWSATWSAVSLRADAQGNHHPQWPGCGR
jgi:hypothetical protein